MNIYIGNLSYTAREDEISKIFGAYGLVESVKIITDRDTGRSKGFAFITMPMKTKPKMPLLH
jgi:RNA recognition motif-containing protein